MACYRENFKASGTTLQPVQPWIQWMPRLFFQKVKRVEREAYHLPTSGVEFNKAYAFILLDFSCNSSKLIRTVLPVGLATVINCRKYSVYIHVYFMNNFIHRLIRGLETNTVSSSALHAQLAV